MSSGRAKRQRRELRRLQSRQSADLNTVQPKEFRQLFGGEGLEPITEDLVLELAARGVEPITEYLVRELVAGGMSEGDARIFARLGFRYSRSRDSFLGPLERFGVLE